MHIPGGNRLIFSRKINIIGLSLERDIESALCGRFQDLAQDNFGTGRVHPSHCLTEPVADPSWDIRLWIPVVEDDITPVVLFKAVLSTYEGQVQLGLIQLEAEVRNVVCTGRNLLESGSRA